MVKLLIVKHKHTNKAFLSSFLAYIAVSCTNAFIY